MANRRGQGGGTDRFPANVTADGDCSHENTSWQEKATANLDSILKSRDITLWTKVHIVKVMDFPVAIDVCEH